MWMGLAVIMMSIRQLTVLMAWRNTFRIVIQVPERIVFWLYADFKYKLSLLSY